MAESSPADPASPPATHPTSTDLKTLDQTTSLVQYAVHQAQFYHKAFNDALDSAIHASKSRISQIRSTSSAHFHQTLGSLDDVKSQYKAYEDLLFGKIKGPRRVMYYNTLCFFVSEESLISRASAEVKQLRQSLELLKAESEKLEKRALRAEGEFLRGRTKLRQAGKQIQHVIHSAYKIERQAAGLKDILGDLPRREASHFWSQVSRLASEAKQEKNALTKEVSKISNSGISV